MWKWLFCAFLVAWCGLPQGEASHFAFGTYNWVQKSGTSTTTRVYDFSFSMVWLKSTLGSATIGSSVAPSGTTSFFPMGNYAGGALLTFPVSGKVDAIYADQNLAGVSNTLTLTLNQYVTSNWRFFFGDCCRLDSIKEGNGAVGYSLTGVLNRFAGSSPKTTGLPRVFAQVGVPFVYTVPITHPDEIPVQYLLAKKIESTLVTPSPIAGSAPFTVDKATGLVRWTPNTQGLYAIAFIVEELCAPKGWGTSCDVGVAAVNGPGATNATCCSRIPLDFLFEVLPPCTNPTCQPPYFDSPFDSRTSSPADREISYVRNVKKTFTVCATAGQPVTVSSSALPPGATFVLLSSVGNRACYTFSWTPSFTDGNSNVCFGAITSGGYRFVGQYCILLDLTPITCAGVTSLPNGNVGSCGVTVPSEQTCNFTCITTGNGPVVSTCSPSGVFTPPIFCAKGAASLTATLENQDPAYGNPLTFNISVDAVAPAKGTPGGTLSFYDNGTLIWGPVPVTSPITIPSPALGKRTITIAYSGDVGFAPSNQTIHIVVNKDLATLTTNVSPQNFGSSFFYNVTLSPATATIGATQWPPTGVVYFEVDDQSVGSGANILGAKQGALTSFAVSALFTGLSGGVHVIKANYLGDSNYLPQSQTWTQTISAAPASLTVSSSPLTSVTGQPVTFTVNVTSPVGGQPSGKVLVLSPSGATLVEGVLVNGVITLVVNDTFIGSNILTVVYESSSASYQSHSTNVTHTVDPAATTVALNLNSPLVHGQPSNISFSVHVANPGQGKPRGDIHLKDGNTIVFSAELNGEATLFLNPSFPAGDYSLVGVYEGEDGFSSSISVEFNFTVNKAHSALKLFSSLPDSFINSPITLTVDATVVAPGNGIPSGLIIIFADNQSYSLGNMSLDDKGIGELTVTSGLTAGIHTLMAVYYGDTNFTGSEHNQTQTISLVEAFIVVWQSGASSTYGEAVHFSANVTSNVTLATGTVQIIDIWEEVVATGTLVNGQITLSVDFLPAGDSILTLRYLGDDVGGFLTGAVADYLIHEVLQASANVTISISPQTLYINQTVFITVTVTPTRNAPTVPTGSLSLVINSNLYYIAYLYNGTATLEFIPELLGDLTLEVEYDGNDNFLGAVTDTKFQVLDDCHYSGCTNVSCNENECSPGQTVCTPVPTQGLPCIATIVGVPTVGVCFSTDCVPPPVTQSSGPPLPVAINQGLTINMSLYVSAPYPGLNYSSLTLRDPILGTATVASSSSNAVITYTSTEAGLEIIYYTIADLYGQIVEGNFTIAISDPCLSLVCQHYDCQIYTCIIGSYPTGGASCYHSPDDDEAACPAANSHAGLCYNGTCKAIVVNIVDNGPTTETKPSIIILTNPSLEFDDAVSDHANITWINNTAFIITPFPPGYLGEIVVNYTIVTIPDGRLINGTYTIEAVEPPPPKEEEELDEEQKLFFLFFLLFPFSIFCCFLFCWYRRKTAATRAEASMNSTFGAGQGPCCCFPLFFCFCCKRQKEEDSPRAQGRGSVQQGATANVSVELHTP